MHTQAVTHLPKEIRMSENDRPEPEPAEPEAPLNRAERRKRAAAQPGHVGPQSDVTRGGRGPRPHTKRRIG